MKLFQLLGICCLFVLITFNSCTEETADSIDVQDINDIDLQLKNYLTDFEVVDLDINDISQSLKSQKSTIKNLNLIPGELEFQLSEPTDLKDVEVFDFEGNKLPNLQLDNMLFDNIDFNKNGNLASFSIIDGELYGEFTRDNISYVISRVSQFVTSAPENKYVIYPSDSYIGIEDEVDSVCEFDMSEDLEEEMNLNEGSISIDKRAKVARVNLFADKSFIRFLNGNIQAMNYMAQTFHQARLKFLNSNMPVKVRLATIYLQNYNGQWGLYHTENVVTMNQRFQNRVLTQRGKSNDLNLLFTKNNKRQLAHATRRSVCQTKTAATMRYIYIEAKRHNLTAHEMAHQMGVTHSPSGIMKGTPPSTPALFSRDSRIKMTRFINSNTLSCLND